MGSEITLSSAVRSNLLSLQKTADLLGRTQERLATGKKVNSALDDPTAFFTASSLNSRANDLSRLQDFVSNAVQTIKAADEGIKALTNLVESAEATVRQASITGGTTASETGTVSGLNTTDTLAAAFGLDATDTIQIGDGTGTTDVVVGALTVQDLLDAVNGDANTDVRASLSGGSLKLEATGANQITIALTDTGAANTIADLGFASGTIAAGTLNTERSNFAAEFDELRNQIDQLINDAGYNGVNLLNGDSLTVTFNEDGSSTLNVTGVTFDSSGLGIGSSQNSFQTDFDIDAAIAELRTAGLSLQSHASSLGSNLSVVETRQDFTKNVINVLETGAANLTLADTNEEGANLLALQTRQQLSSTALSLASQADQNVLRLFQ